MENLKNKIIDISKEEWSFVKNEKLNGMIYICGTEAITYMEPKTLDKIKEDTIKQVDKETRNKIISIANEDKQRTYLAKYNDLMQKEFSGIITEEEKVQMSQIKSVWEVITNLIIEGNTLENSISECKTEEEINTLLGK